MIRQAKRKRQREIKKELEYIEKHTPFLKLMKSSEFEGIPQEDLDLLNKNEHPNKDKQARYIKAVGLFTRVVKLNEEYATLETSKEERLSRPVENTHP